MLKEISVEIIRKCPNHCLHCSSFSDSTRLEKMSIDKFKELVDDAKALGAMTICLSGGEPFLHENIMEMTKYVHDIGLNTYIYTSGIVFDDNGTHSHIPDSTLKSISKYSVKIIFNVEAGTEKTYDKIMGTKNCYPKMQLSIINAKKYNIPVEAHFVPMKLNINEIDDVVSLCQSIGISKLSFLRLVSHGRAKQNEERLKLTEKEYLYLKEKLQIIKNNSEISIRIGVPLNDDNTCTNCEAAQGKLNIKYDGYVYPCEVFKNFDFKTTLKDLKPASIYENRLLQIYHDSQYLKSVRKLNEHCETKNHESCLGQYLMELENKGV